MIGHWLARAGDRYVEAVVWWVERMRRTPWLALGLTIAVTVVAGHYAVRTLTINTDPSSLLSSDLPARRLYQEFEKVFPQFADSIVIVIDGDSPDRAEDAMFALVPALTAEKDLFRTVFAPQTDPFFRRNGLLFLDLEEVQDLSDRVARSQGMLADRKSVV